MAVPVVLTETENVRKVDNVIASLAAKVKRRGLDVNTAFFDGREKPITNGAVQRRVTVLIVCAKEVCTSYLDAVIAISTAKVTWRGLDVNSVFFDACGVVVTSPAVHQTVTDFVMYMEARDIPELDDVVAMLAAKVAR